MKRFSLSQIMCVCVTFISLMLSMTIMSNAQVPKSMNYQGYLTDAAGNPLNNSVQMTFVLYDAATGGTALWQETQSVQCQQGYYNAILGQPGNPINLMGPKQYYLGVKVGMDAELTPRQPIMSVMSALFVDGLRFLGEDTTIVNKEAWYSNTTGFGNTYLGKGAGVSNTTGNKNVFVGAWAGDHNTDGLCNTFMGYGAGNQNTTGNGNTFLGHVAGNANQSGWGNTFVGHVTGNKNTGSMNTFIGAGAGDTNITGDGNILIGHQAGRYEMGSNRLYIANSETPTPLLYGEFDTQKLAVNGNLGIDQQNPQAKLTISGIPLDGEGLTTRPNFGEGSVFIENVNSYFDYVAGLTFRGTGADWATRFTATDNMLPDGHIVMIQSEEPTPGAWGETIAVFNNNGNVGIGTPTPQSKLQIANGYLQLATVTGMPPAADCDNQAEYGRMMVSPADSKLWICVAAGWISK